MKFAMLALTAIVVLVFASAGWAQPPYSIEIMVQEDYCTIIYDAEDQRAELGFEYKQIRRTDREVYIDGALLADQDGFHLAGRLIPFSSSEIRRVRAVRGEFSVLLEPKIEAASERRFRGRDLVTAFEQLTIVPKEFVRGDLLSVGGDLSIEGEVNGHVVALFADVNLTRSATCRKDVLAVGGYVRRHDEAKVYGDYQGTENWRRWRPDGEDDREGEKSVVDFGATAEYNRVDGVAVQAGVKFHSEEEFMPELFADYGYGFWSKRSKYRIGLKQTLFDFNQLSFGGEVYRQTRTEDEWRCGKGENNLYALLAREDFRDYYEGEGGSFFVEQIIGYDHTVRVDYKFEELAFMEANLNLWSLFGGDKKFRTNFSSVSNAFRRVHLSDYELDEATLGLKYTYNTAEDRYGELLRSGWLAEINYEHSSDVIGSDFDYDRLVLELRRYQPLTYRQNLNLRLRFGTANGDLPLHRYFYLGGIRTLRAFDIKELYGTRLALANLEYGLDFPRTDLGVVAFFDVGKTGWDGDFLTEGGWQADVGLGLTLGDLRLELSRQINGDTNDIQFSVLIGRSF
jgi:hypothetical protein